MVERTSETHPLRLNWVSTRTGWGRIGVTFCPGKKQLRSFSGGWDRDLVLDIKAIEHSGACAVLSLLEGHEIQMLAVPALGNMVGEAKMDWFHLPIQDGRIPEAKFRLAWAAVGRHVRIRIRNGFSVVVHCKGGLGRAGTIAAQLLIELGLACPREAISAVRATRPGAIENRAQEEYLEGILKVDDVSPSLSAEAVEDRAVGAIVGLAVGDALGTTLEFTARDRGAPLLDMVGGGPFNLKAGQWTDDTAMALALLDSLLRDPLLDEMDLLGRFTEWWQTGTYSCTGRCFDIGLTTRAALTRWQQTANPRSGSPLPESAGNGSLMRLAPVATRHFKNPERLRDVAARQSATTHAASECIDSCVGFAEALAEAINGKPLTEVLRQRETDFCPKAAAVFAGSWRGKRRKDIKSSGYVIDTLEAAMWCVGRTNSFKDAVLLAANLRGDADTVAAVTGQLAGALYGASSVPVEWLEKLAWKDHIIAKSKHLARLAATRI